MKRILITGGAGFIGSNLCKKLKEIGDAHITSLDNYTTGTEMNHIKGVEYQKGDTTEIDSRVKGNFDQIYHLGEYSRVEQSFDDISKVWNSNKTGTFSVFEFARKRAGKIIYAGSSTKFGDGGLGRNQSPYAWTKASNTELIESYRKWFGLNFATVYFYNAYGPNEITKGKYATLIGLFARKMRLGEDLTIVAPGSQRRNFTHVKDIVDGLHLVGEKGEGDEFGIGSPESYSIIEIAEMFGGRIKIIPQRKGNRFSAEVVDDKTRLLGWQPTKKIEDYVTGLKNNNWEP
ncbi:NAD-dependent epimerase/dehydratase family protein [Litorivicinus sp.]|nr:NAD-dependent epimerase/dehydratase family protein [Litorivicinus sp.]